VRRALTWLAGAVGLAALARHRSRSRSQPVPAGLVVDEDPADELRRKLAEQRDGEARDDEGDESEDEPDAAADLVDLEARQEAIELMRDGGDAPAEAPDDDDSVA
jgi:hypothetical protein